MYLIDVSPILPALREPYYSYRCDTPVSIGALVRIPWRRKTVYGIVVATTPLRDAKTRIKEIGVSLKKAEPISGVMLHETEYSTLETIAEKNISSIGSVLSSLYPWSSTPEASNTFEEKMERLYAITHESTINKPIEHLSIHATAQSAENAYERQDSAVPKQASPSALLTGTKTKKHIAKEFDAIIERERTHIIATTPYAGFFIPYTKDITIHDAWRAPKHQKEPYLDYIDYIKTLAEKCGTRIALEQKSQTHPIALIEKPHDTEIEETLYQALKDRISHNKKSIVFAERKNMYAYIACMDCGTITTCPECATPFSLISLQTRQFHCHSCGKTSTPKDVCTICGGTRLALRRPGIESLAEHIKKAAPDASITVITKESTPTRKQFMAFIQKIIESDIIITTSAGFDVLEGLFSTLDARSAKKYAVFLPYMYSLVSLPDYRISEKIRNTTHLLAYYADTYFFTTEQHKSLCEATIMTDVETFTTNEKRVRESAEFPPFGHIIKISYRGNVRALRSFDPFIEAVLACTKKESLAHKLMPQLKKGLTIMGGLIIHTPRHISESLVALLRDTPPAIRLDIDPDRFSW